MDQSSNVQEGTAINCLDLLPWHIIDGIVQHLDLNASLALASLSPYLDSRVNRISATGYIVHLFPTRNGRIIDKWQVAEKDNDPLWTLRVPLDDESTCLHLIQELFRLVRDVQALRVIDYDLVDMVLKFGRENPGLFSGLRLFEYQDTIYLSYKRNIILFHQIKREIPNLGEIRNIRHYSSPYGFMVRDIIYSDCPQFQWANKAKQQLKPDDYKSKGYRQLRLTDFYPLGKNFSGGFRQTE